MIGKKIKLNNDYLENHMGIRYRDLDNVGDVYAIVLDRYIGINKYDTLENCSHSSNYIYLSTDYYLIQILECSYEEINKSLKFYGNVRSIKPNQITQIVE